MAALDDSEAHEPSLHRDKEPAPVGELSLHAEEEERLDREQTKAAIEAHSNEAGERRRPLSLSLNPDFSRPLPANLHFQ